MEWALITAAAIAITIVITAVVLAAIVRSGQISRKQDAAHAVDKAALRAHREYVNARIGGGA